MKSLQISKSRTMVAKLTSGFIGVTLLLASFLLPADVKAQQDPMYSQYMFNHQVLNPAYAGSWGYLTSTLIYRKQWVGMNGAPETQSFSMHLPSRNDRHGFGIGFVNDQIGIIKTNEWVGLKDLKTEFKPQRSTNAKFLMACGITASNANKHAQPKNLGRTCMFAQVVIFIQESDLKNILMSFLTEINTMSFSLNWDQWICYNL